MDSTRGAGRHKWRIVSCKKEKMFVERVPDARDCEEVRKPVSRVDHRAPKLCGVVWPSLFHKTNRTRVHAEHNLHARRTDARDAQSRSRGTVKTGHDAGRRERAPRIGHQHTAQSVGLRQTSTTGYDCCRSSHGFHVLAQKQFTVW